ncbi:membrane protein US12D [Cercopithecine betaherpesvirus 5]|uniref:Membrane protein US12D n=1 Tax=Simian cytomegalovirus (strain Colburn) TaxID=50292 RepID=G8XU55_SCMVC|nr:membrane protein US12D [Cercopithecine betaherpesvirus 5]
MENHDNWSVCWLRRMAIIFQVYAWLGLQVALTVALYGVYRMASSDLIVDCKADPAPMLMILIPTAILILEHTSRSIGNTLQGLLWETYCLISSCIILTTCTDGLTVLRSFLLTMLMFLTQSGMAVLDNMQTHRRKIITAVCMMIVLFTMSIVYSFGGLTPCDMLFITVYVLLLMLTSLIVYCETLEIRHRHTSKKIKGPAVLLFVSIMLLFEGNVLVLSPKVWSAEWNHMFSSLAALHSYFNVTP